jgi:hypothetical protein
VRKSRREFWHRDIDTRDIGGPEVEKSETFQVPKQRKSRSHPFEGGCVSRDHPFWRFGQGFTEESL